MSPISNAEVALLTGAIFALLVYCGVPRLTVLNGAAVQLTAVTISGDGFAQTVDSLEPGESHTFWFLPAGDTSVRVAFLANDQRVNGGRHGYYQAPPRAQLPSTVTIDRELRPTFRQTRLPLPN